MLFVRRSEWGAPATSDAAYIASTRGVKVHYLGTAYSSRSHTLCDDYVRSIRASHLANTTENYVDIAYNLLVCEHGWVYEGRGAHRRTGANGNATLNTQHYAVCGLLGSSGLTQPTDAMLNGIRDAIEYLQEHGDAGPEIKGHRDGYATSCPGQPLYNWVVQGAPRPASSSSGTYTVKAGDTLTSIAAAHKTTVATLVELNSLTDPNSLAIGQVLKVPATTQPAPAPAPVTKPTVDLSRLVAAARTDPPKSGTPVSYSGVKVVEQALVAEKLLDPGLADGHYGTATRTAYATWQRRLGYSGTAADGIPGKTSLAKLGAKHGFTVVD